MKKTIVYIDGFNISYGLHDINPCVKRLIIDKFDDESLVTSLTERFMDLAVVKFK